MGISSKIIWRLAIVLLSATVIPSNCAKSESKVVTVKAAIGFKTKGLGTDAKVCVLINGKWKAALSLKKGKAKLLTSSEKATHAKCKLAGARFSKGGTIYTKVSGTQGIGAHTSSTFIRIGSTGVGYPVIIGALPSSPGAIFVLPNGFTLVEISAPPILFGGESCYYGLISPSGTSRCLSGVKNIIFSSSLSAKVTRDIQVGPDSSVYFVGTTVEQESSLFKISATGVVGAFYTAPALSTISGFAVLNDGGVLVALEVANSSDINDPDYDEAPAIVMISALGSTTLLSADVRLLSSNKGVGWLAKLYDQRAYLGLTNYSNSGSSASTTASIYRQTDSLDSLEEYITPANSGFCSGISTGPVCGYGSTIIRGLANTTSATFVVAQQPLLSNLISSVVQVAPALSTLALSNISTPTGIAAYGDVLVIAGLNGAGTGMLISYDTDTDTETVLSQGILIGDGPYFSQQISSFLAYGSDLTTFPPRTYSIQLPVSSSGAFGSLVKTELSSFSSVSFVY